MSTIIIIYLSYTSLLGYRDAECGWIVVEEDEDDKIENRPRRRALFVVIYAPKRGILEVSLIWF